MVEKVLEYLADDVVDHLHFYFWAKGHAQGL